MKKTINRLKLLKDYWLKKTQISGLPLELVIEVTNKCNLNCVMCLRKKMTRKQGFINLNLYRKIIDEVSSFLELVYLHGEGEPLMHPEIDKMIQYAKSKNLMVGLSTNATILTKIKAESLIKSGLDYLIIAIDATTSQTYERVRGGKFFHQVVSNTKTFLKMKKRVDKSPYTVVQMVRVKENSNEASEFKAYWQKQGADIVRIKPAIDLLQEKIPAKPVTRPCFYLWRQLNMIAWNGKFVTPCCMDAEGDYSLGDANTQSIKEIWNGKPMMALRRAHRNGDWKKVAICRNCTYPQPSNLGKIGALLIPEVTIKKFLPLLENKLLSNFFIDD